MKKERVSALNGEDISYLSCRDFEKAILDLEKKENNSKIIGFRAGI